jgi:hypothetical protein
MTPDRRSFLRTAGRWSLAAALTGGVGALSLGRRDRCSTTELCGGCEARQTCELPQAAAFRAAEHAESGYRHAREARQTDTP